MNSRLLTRTRLLLLSTLLSLSGYSNAMHHQVLGDASLSPLTLKQSHSRHETVLAQAKKGISKSQAASAAQSKYGGKVINVSQRGNSYRVKLLLDSGKVKIVTVDATTGQAR